MKKATLLLPLLLLLPVLTGCVSSAPDSDEQLLVEDAYALQRISVLQHSGRDPVIGYKAGLTSAKGQEAFGADEPLVGALFTSGLSRDRGAYLLSNYHDLRLETELGFILRKPITQPISEAQLPEYIKSMVPVVELPNLRFANPESITAAALVSSNVASNQFIVGKPQYFNPQQVNRLQTTLSKNGVIINRGKATDAMGSQTKALVWMINHLLKVGYSLEENQLLITGALGAMLPAEKGQYEARFGPDATSLEQSSLIAFSIR